jgi:hypothetical protein
VQADLDGESMDDVEFAFFDNPDQWKLFKNERPATAVDEIVRWVRPTSTSPSSTGPSSSTSCEIPTRT